MRIRRVLFSIFLIFTFSSISFGQTETSLEEVKYKIIKQNGSSFVGKIVSRDARDILLETENIGLVYIPKHEIDEIILLMSEEEEVSGGLFSTRYFLTTNGFHINKGDNYIQWNLFGPDFQFGVAENVTLGIMTSWVGMPIIGTAKYSRQISEKLYGGVGFLGGTGSWAFPQYGLMLPFGFLSTGNRVNNLNFSAGYGLIFAERYESHYTLINTPTDYSTNEYQSNGEQVNYSEGRPLFSIAGMFRINDKFSFVFDSFFMLGGRNRDVERIHDVYDPATEKVTYSIRKETVTGDPLLVLAPGLRFQANENSSFQFGFTGIYLEGEFVPVPIPMVQWFKRI